MNLVNEHVFLFVFLNARTENIILLKVKDIYQFLKGINSLKIRENLLFLSYFFKKEINFTSIFKKN